MLQTSTSLTDFQFQPRLIEKEQTPNGSIDTFSARWVDSVVQLEGLLKEWDSLAANSIWKNPAFEHNYLIPALKHLTNVEGNNDKVKVLVVEGSNSNGEMAPVLCGLLPLETVKIYRLPISAVESWKHDQCFDATPLIRQGVEIQTIRTILEFLADEKVGLLSLDTVSAEPEFKTAIDSVIASKRYSTFQRDRFRRAAFTPAADTKQYLAENLSKSVKKNHGRLGRRLNEQGTVTFETSDESSNFEELAEQFLKIESSGWKGENGTALSSKPSTESFYRELISRSAQVGKARFVSMLLDGKPIAMISDIQSGNHVYSYKTSYDESFSAFSPGQQVEIKNIEFLHRDGVETADSCTDPDNASINRIWGQGLDFQNLVIGLRPGLPSVATKVCPWMQRLANYAKAKLSK